MVVVVLMVLVMVMVMVIKHNDMMVPEVSGFDWVHLLGRLGLLFTMKTMIIITI